jgi:signal transduction histidine kinase
MMNVFNKFQNGFRFLFLHPQFTLTLLLIVVIPVSFLVYGQSLLNIAEDTQNSLERERIGMLHDLFSTQVLSHEDNYSELEQEMIRIASLNSDIVSFFVVKEDGEALVVIASIRPEDAGEKIEKNLHFRMSHAEPNTTISFPYAEAGVRYWQSYRLIEHPSQTKYYIFTQTSLEKVDVFISNGIKDAYHLLFGIMIIIIFLLYRHVRLIDYSYLYRETKRENEMKDMFTNMIAHELRAPLTAMKGYASMVREKEDAPSDVREYGQKIEDAAGRLVLIINDLLDVARIHSGKLAVKPERVNMQDVLTSVIEIMKKPAEEKNITLSQDGLIPDLFINADPTRLHQAFTNLVSNSIKYTKAGSITISILERDDRVEVRVKDTGAGISAENQKSLFTPFFRVSSKDVDNTVGTGLGMWITKQLIELMQGSIAVESIQGVGTHIVVTLPKK